MSKQGYGYTVLLVSAEALLGSLISYPQIKDLLVRQRVHIRELSYTLQLFLLVLPVSAIAVYLYFSSLLAASVVLVGSAFFGLSQVLLYLHRIDNLQAYNRMKVAAATLSTAVFLLILPTDPHLLPLVQISYFAALASGFRRDSRFNWTQLFNYKMPGSQISTWGIYGTQSLIANATVYGTRLLAGAVMSLQDVGVFTLNYMIASGVTFYYAAVMIYAEKDLSHELDLAGLPKRLRKSVSTLGILWAGLVAYALVVGVGLWFCQQCKALPAINDVQPNLLFTFAGLFLIRGLVLVINPIVIAIGMRRMSLGASLAGGAALACFSLTTWSSFGMQGLAMAMGVSLAAQSVVLLSTIIVGLQSRGQAKGFFS